MAILRTGGQVRNELLDVLGTVAPGIRGVTKGGVSIRGHLDKWGKEVLDTGLFNTSLEQLLKTESGKNRAKTIVKKIKTGDLSFVGLLGAIWLLNGKKFTNVGDDPRIKTLFQFAVIAALYEQVVPLAQLGKELGAISVFDEFQAKQRLNAAAVQVLGIPQLVDILD